MILLVGRYFTVNQPKTTESQQSATWKQTQSTPLEANFLEALKGFPNHCISRETNTMQIDTIHFPLFFSLIFWASPQNLESLFSCGPRVDRHGRNMR